MYVEIDKVVVVVVEIMLSIYRYYIRWNALLYTLWLVVIEAFCFLYFYSSIWFSVYWNKIDCNLSLKSRTFSLNVRHVWPKKEHQEKKKKHRIIINHKNTFQIITITIITLLNIYIYIFMILVQQYTKIIYDGWKKNM